MRSTTIQSLIHSRFVCSAASGNSLDQIEDLSSGSRIRFEGFFGIFIRMFKKVMRRQRTSSPEQRYCYTKASFFDRASNGFLSFRPVELALMKNGSFPASRLL